METQKFSQLISRTSDFGLNKKSLRKQGNLLRNMMEPTISRGLEFEEVNPHSLVIKNTRDQFKNSYITYQWSPRRETRYPSASNDAAILEWTMRSQDAILVLVHDGKKYPGISAYLALKLIKRGLKIYLTPDMIDAIKTMANYRYNRGPCFYIVHDVREINDETLQVERLYYEVYRCSNCRSRGDLKYCARCETKKQTQMDDVEAQIFSIPFSITDETINKIGGSISNVVGEVGSKVSNLGSCLDARATKLLSTASATVNQAISKMKVQGLETTLNLTDRILDIAELAMDIYAYRDMKWALIVAKVLTSLKRIVRSWDIEIPHFILESLTRHWRTDTVQAEISGGDVRLFCGAIGAAFVCLFSVMMPQVFANTKVFDDVLRRIDLIPKAFSGIGKVYNAANDMFYSSFEAVVKACGFTVEADQQCVSDRFIIKTTDLVQKMRDGTLDIDHKKDILSLLTMRKEVQTLMMNRREAFAPEKRTILNKALISVDDLCEHARSKGWIYEGGQAPVAVQLVGDTGVGKSTLVYPMCAFLAQYMDIDTTTPDFNVKEYIWDFPKSSDHFDGYDKQPIVYIDDGFQVKDSPASPNKEVMAIIQMVNEARFIMPMAHLSSKGTVFDSRLILMTTNAENFSIRSIECPEAALRRFKYRIRVSVIPEVQKGGTGAGSTGLDETKLRHYIGPDYQYGKFYPEIYRFDVLENIWKGKNPDQTYTQIDFKHMLRLMRQMILDQQEKHTVRKDEYRQFTHYDVDAEIGGFLSSFYREDMEVPPSLRIAPEDYYEEDGEYLDAGDSVIEDESIWQKMQKYVQNHKTQAAWISALAIGVSALGYFIWSQLPQEAPQQYIPSRKFKRFEVATRGVQGGTLCEDCIDISDELGIEAIGENRPIILAYQTVKGLDLCGCESEHYGPKDQRAQPRTEHYGPKDQRQRPRTEHYGPKDQRQRPRTEHYGAQDKRTRPRTEGVGRIEYMKDAPLLEQLPSMEMSQDQNLDHLIQSHIRNNTCTIRSGAKVLRGLMVRGQTMLVNAHIQVLLSSADILTIEFNNSTLKVPVDTCSLQLGDNDTALLSSPLFRRGKDLVKYFVMERDLVEKSFNDVALYIHDTIPRIHSSSAKLNVNAVTMSVTGGPSQILTRTINYSCTTQPGHCGSPCLVVNNRLDRKIVGIHAYGSVGMCRNGAVVITQEILSDLLSKVKTEYRTPTAQFKDDDRMIKGAAGLLGSVDPIFSPNKTNFRLNPEAEKLAEQLAHPIATKPAHLKTVLVGDKLVDPLQRGMGKVLNPNNIIETEDVKTLTVFMENLLLTNYVRSERPHEVLSVEDAIFGRDGDYPVEPMDLSKSPGYPWTSRKEPGKAGKRTWINPENHEVSTELLDAIESKRHGYLTGEKSDTIFTALLKDERRPIAKVDAGKTRIFYGGPQCFTILFRQYFLQFMNFLQDNRIFNGTAVGINPLGPEWKMLYTKLSAAGKQAIAGDFEQFDGSMLKQIQDIFVELANIWYNDNEENQLIRKQLWLDVTQAQVLYKDSVIVLEHGMASGCPATAVANSVYNLSVTYLSLARCRPERLAIALQKAREETFVICYGDDNIISLGQTEQYDAISDVMASIGMNYTSEDKSGKAHRKALDEVTFLKRQFKQFKGLTLAPISEETIYELFYWHRSAEDDETQIVVNMENGMRELALWADEKKYNAVKSALRAYCSDHNMKLQPRFTTMMDEICDKYM